MPYVSVLVGPLGITLPSEVTPGGTVLAVVRVLVLLAGRLVETQTEEFG